MSGLEITGLIVLAFVVGALVGTWDRAQWRLRLDKMDRQLDALEQQRAELMRRVERLQKPE